MKLLDEIAARLSDLPLSDGVGASDLASHFAITYQEALDIIPELESAGHCKVVKRGNGFYLVSIDHNQPICEVCKKEFEYRTSKLPSGRVRTYKRRTCSRSCAVSLSWKSPEVSAQRRSSIKTARKSPEARARIAKLNKERWSDPSEREKLSKRNRERWSDPETNAKLSASIAKAARTPDRRKELSERMKKRWDDPKTRAELEEAARIGRQKPEYRESLRRAMKKRWANPKQREQLLKAVELNRLKATKAHKSKKVETTND